MSNGVSFNSVDPTYYGIQSNPRQCPRERSYLNEQCYDSVSFSGKEESNNTAGWIIRGTLALVGLTAGVAACFKGGRKWYSDTFNKIKSVFTGDTPDVNMQKIKTKKDSVDKVINNFDKKEELEKVLSNIKDDKNSNNISKIQNNQADIYKTTKQHYKDFNSDLTTPLLGSTKGNKVRKHSTFVNQSKIEDCASDKDPFDIYSRIGEQI